MKQQSFDDFYEINYQFPYAVKKLLAQVPGQPLKQTEFKLKAKILFARLQEAMGQVKVPYDVIPAKAGITENQYIGGNSRLRGNDTLNNEIAINRQIFESSFIIYYADVRENFHLSQIVWHYQHLICQESLQNFFRNRPISLNFQFQIMSRLYIDQLDNARPSLFGYLTHRYNANLFDKMLTIIEVKRDIYAQMSPEEFSVFLKLMSPNIKKIFYKAYKNFENLVISYIQNPEKTELGERIKQEAKLHKFLLIYPYNKWTSEHVINMLYNADNAELAGELVRINSFAIGMLNPQLALANFNFSHTELSALNGVFESEQQPPGAAFYYRLWMQENWMYIYFFVFFTISINAMTLGPQFLQSDIAEQNMDPQKAKFFEDMTAAIMVGTVPLSIAVTASIIYIINIYNDKLKNLALQGYERYLDSEIQIEEVVDDLPQLLADPNETSKLIPDPNVTGPRSFAVKEGQLEV